MPPKGWKKYPDGFKPANSNGVPLEDRPVYGIEDLLLPRQSITKIAKEVLPDKTPLPKDGVTALLRSSTVFISYIAAEANRIADRAGRKIIGPADVIAALEEAHMGAFSGSVQGLAEKLKQQQSENKRKGEAVDSEDTIEDDAETMIAKTITVQSGPDDAMSTPMEVDQ